MEKEQIKPVENKNEEPTPEPVPEPVPDVHDVPEKKSKNPVGRPKKVRTPAQLENDRRLAEMNKKRHAERRAIQEAKKNEEIEKIVSKAIETKETKTSKPKPKPKKVIQVSEASSSDTEEEIVYVPRKKKQKPKKKIVYYSSSSESEEERPVYKFV